MMRFHGNPFFPLARILHESLLGVGYGVMDACFLLV